MISCLQLALIIDLRRQFGILQHAFRDNFFLVEALRELQMVMSAVCPSHVVRGVTTTLHGDYGLQRYIEMDCSLPWRCSYQKLWSSWLRSFWSSRCTSSRRSEASGLECDQSRDQNGVHLCEQLDQDMTLDHASRDRAAILRSESVDSKGYESELILIDRAGRYIGESDP